MNALRPTWLGLSRRRCLALLVISAVVFGWQNVKAAENGAHARSQLGQISTRGQMGHNNSIIGGFIITGTQPKKIIARALGPSMSLPNAVKDPYLALYTNPGGRVGANDDWEESQRDAIVATTIPPREHLESAYVATLNADSTAYTAVGHTKNYNDHGIGLVEIYDLDLEADSELANISTRGTVETGDNILIAGFTVLGDQPLRVILRAIGPSMQKNLLHETTVTDPTLELRDRNGLQVAANDNWRSDQEEEIKATTIPPEDERESAILQTLAEGPYTAILRSANGSAGLALVEVYALP